MSTPISAKDLYANVTNAIIASLEAGVRPWVKPWADKGNGMANTMRPLRHNGAPYSGVNVLILWAEASAKGYASPFWATFKQWQEYGASVRKGEKATTVVYASSFEKREVNAEGEVEKDRIFFLKGYAVFNADQVDNLPAKFPKYGKVVDAPEATEVARDANAEAFIAATGAIVRHGGDRAYYVPSADCIQLPEFGAFENAEAYYGTALHELVHWTGHESRCNRDLTGRFGSESYAVEELVAELGAAFLCADLGVEPEVRDDHAAYVASWLRVLKNDKRAIFTAASMAQRAAEYLAKSQAVPEELPVAA